VREIFHKANIRPGKPVYFGRSSALVFGLPGNPVSCHVTARVFVEPALCAFMRLPEQKEMIRLAHAVNKQHSMQEYLRVRKDAQGLAVKTQHNGSGDIFASTRADGLAVLAAEARDLPEGSEVEYLAFGW
jgi:molybdopterin molybdotransferase